MWKTKRHADEGFSILNPILIFTARQCDALAVSVDQIWRSTARQSEGLLVKILNTASRIQSGWLQLLPRPNQRRPGRNLRYSCLAEDDSETTIQRSTVRVRFSMLESCVDDVRKVVWRLSRRQWYPVGSLPTPSPRRQVFPKISQSDISC